MGIFGFFSKKEKNVGYWYMIDFSEAAKEYSVGNDFCKKISLMYNNQLAGEVFNYTAAKAKLLRLQGNVVLDLTQGQLVPQESVMIPRTEAAFGTIQLFRRV
jgi:hypothetical protein